MRWFDVKCKIKYYFLYIFRRKKLNRVGIAGKISLISYDTFHKECLIELALSTEEGRRALAEAMFSYENAKNIINKEGKL
jgi:hypothetical protein